MKFSITLILCIIQLLALACQSALAEIKTTYSVTSSTVKELENWLDKGSMVFITLDEVLVVPDYQMFSYNNNPYRNFVEQLIAHAKNDKFYVSKLENWYKQRKLRLVEEEWVGFINRLKSKGIKVFGVCEMPIPIKDIEKRRYLEVINLGIKFNPDINGENVLVLGEEAGWLSLFYQGIIYTGPLNAANAIENFMKVSMEVPKKLAYFGMQPSQVKRIDRMLRPFNMEFYNYIYLGIKNYLPIVDFEHLQFQQMHFLQTSVLLSDQEVIKLIKAKQQETTDSNVVK